MTGPAYPFTAFNFAVEINRGQEGGAPLANAAFAECDGLEMSIELKTVREGGNNREQIHLMGPTSYGQLTLRRGMTANLDLWRWFVAAATPGRVSTALGLVTLWDPGGTPQLTFALKGCLPTRMRGPSLNAKDGQVAIEELQLAYARLDVRPAGQGGDFGLGLGVGVGVTGGDGVGDGVGVGVGVAVGAAVAPPSAHRVPDAGVRRTIVLNALRRPPDTLFPAIAAVSSAPSIRARATAPTEAFGAALHASAAAPDTCGVAIDVPPAYISSCPVNEVE